MKTTVLKIGDLLKPALASHIIVRADHVLCTRCYKTESVHPGHGTAMSTIVLAYVVAIARHQDCGGSKKRAAHPPRAQSGARACYAEPGRPCRAQGKATAQIAWEPLRTYHQERKSLARSKAIPGG